MPPRSGKNQGINLYSILQALILIVELANIFPIKLLLFVLLIINE